MTDETQSVQSSQARREQRLEEVLAEYLRRVEAGEEVDRQAILALHPDLAEELRQFFANQARLARIVGAPGGAPAGNDSHPARPTKLRYFGDYEILDEIAAGGMGVVYKARQSSLNRTVAVKMILAGQLANEAEVKRFQAEAEAAANLHHPGVVAIHEVGVQDGQHYFSMEYVEGPNLAQLIREKPLSATQSAAYVRDMADVLEYAHAQGVLHRDLKPSNVLIDASNRVRITDFGLAKRVTGESDLTLTGQVIGTPSYMPPEQAAAQHAVISAASDVYALGAILYELIAGRPPFRADNAGETLRQVQHDDPVRPRLLNPRLPRDLETICLKCLEKEPRRRYGTAQQLGDELGRFLRGDPILARPVGRIERVSRWCRKRPALASLSAALILLIGVVIPGLLWFHTQRLGQELTRTQQAERTAQDKLATSYLHLAQARRRSKSVGQRHDSLRAIEDSLQIVNKLELSKQERTQRVAELRMQAIAALALPDLRVIREASVSEVGWPGGMDAEFTQFTWLAHPAGDLSVRRIDDGTEVAWFPGKHVWSAKISPDGKVIASADGLKEGLLKVWQIGEPKPVFTTPWANAPWEFSPDGRRLAVGNRQGSADLYDVPTRTLLRQIKTPGIPVRMDFHPSGGRLALTCSGMVRVFDVESGAAVPGPLIRGVDDIAWHPDGVRLAATQQDGTIEVWDTALGRHETTMAGDDGNGVVLAFDASGAILASSGWQSELRLWHAATGELLLRTRNEFSTYQFHRQQPWLGPISRGLQVTVSEVAIPAVFRTLVHPPAHTPSRYFRIAASPDNRLLAVQLLSGVALLDLASGRELGFLPLGPAAPVFEPSGALLTVTQQALFRWPIRADAAGVLHLGPPTKLLAFSAPHAAAAISADGGVLAFCVGDGALVWRIGGPDPPRLLPHFSVRYVDISSDGKWVATGFSSAKVWDATTGTLVHEFEEQALSSDVEFSPDGRWLTTAGGRHRLWRVGSWESGPDLGPAGNESRAGAFATTANGATVMVIAPGDGTLRLVDPETGSENACLTNPTLGRNEYLAFTPDGRRLIGGNNDSHTIDVWDIAALRAELSQRGLDWDAPPYPVAPAIRPIVALKIEGDTSSFIRAWAEAEVPQMTERLANRADDGEAAFRRGQAYLHVGKVELALQDLQFAGEQGVDILKVPESEPWFHADWRHWQLDLKSRVHTFSQHPADAQWRAWAGYDAYAVQEHSRALQYAQEALQIDANDATANNILARIFLLGPPSLRDAEKGLSHALRAYQKEPSYNHGATLAAAHYRLDRPDAAKKLLATPGGGIEGIRDLVLLALVEKQSGNMQQARELYQRASQQLAAWQVNIHLAELGEIFRLSAEAKVAFQED